MILENFFGITKLDIIENLFLSTVIATIRPAQHSRKCTKQMIKRQTKVGKNGEAGRDTKILLVTCQMSLETTTS